MNLHGFFAIAPAIISFLLIASTLASLGARTDSDTSVDGMISRKLRMMSVGEGSLDGLRLVLRFRPGSPISSKNALEDQKDTDDMTKETRSINLVISDNTSQNGSETAALKTPPNESEGDDAQESSDKRVNISSDRIITLSDSSGQDRLEEIVNVPNYVADLLPPISLDGWDHDDDRDESLSLCNSRGGGATIIQHRKPIARVFMEQTPHADTERTEPSYYTKCSCTGWRALRCAQLCCRSQRWPTPEYHHPRVPRRRSITDTCGLWYACCGYLCQSLNDPDDDWSF